MKYNYNKITMKVLSTVSLSVLICGSVMAGNKDRAGQAGAGQLLINPWGQSSALGGANVASVNGVEATFGNVAGLAFVNSTEVLFTNTSYLKGSGISINSIGLGQKVGESGVLGLSLVSFNMGDNEVTTVDKPEGGIGTFRPQFMNLGLSYAKTFSNSIYGGFTIRALSEGVSDATARGASLDAGIRYVTGKLENVKFGISLKNVGPKMQSSGDGFSSKAQLVNNSPFSDEEFTIEWRTEPYEMPSLLNIGLTYDYYLGAKADSTGKISKSDHRISASGTFTANSFGKDQIRGGLEYGFRNYFSARVGYVYEEGLNNVETRTNAVSGISGGFSLQLPINKKGSVIGLDYSYRHTNPFFGIHSIGARISI